MPIGDIRDPVIAAHVGDAEEVEAIDANPEVFQAAALFDGSEAHTDIRPFVGRCPELLVCQALMRGAKGQSVGKRQSQGHFPSVGTGEIVGEMEVYRPALVGRKRNPRVAQFLSGRH